MHDSWSARYGQLQLGRGTACWSEACEKVSRSGTQPSRLVGTGVGGIEC